MMGDNIRFKSEEAIRSKQAYVENISDYQFRDRIRTFMKTGKAPLGSVYLEDASRSNYMVVKDARKRGEIPGYDER
jgi:hypothetical protein